MSGRRDALWTVAVTGISALCQLLQLAVAARYLDAEAFGVFAIVNVTLWVVLAVQDMGLSSYCVHLGETDRRSQSTLFWISSLLGGIAALIVLLVMQPLAWFYSMPELKILLPWVALNFILLGLSAQYQANLIRVFRAKLLAQMELMARLISFALTLWLLIIMNWGLLSLVIGTATFALLKLLALMVVAERHWHPQLCFDRRLAAGALHYGGFQLSAQLVNQLRSQADVLIVGKALGAEVLGIYSLARELISYPLRFMMPLISRLVLPRLAQVQHEHDKLRSIFLQGLARTAWLAGAVYALLSLLSLWIVEILYGAQYLAVAALVPLLGLFGALRPLGLNTGMLAQALGRTSNEFKWNLLCAVISLPLMLLVAWLFPVVEAFALALSAQQLLLTVLAYRYFIRPLNPVGFGLYARAWAWMALIMLPLFWLASMIHLPSISELQTHVVQWVVLYTGWRG